MRRLIASEFKKIWKSKVNIILLVLLIGFSFFMNIRNYQAETINYDTTVEVDGNVLNSLEIRQQLDKKAQAFAGPINADKFDKIFEEYTSLMKETQNGDEIDKEQMEEFYGSDYQTYIDKVLNHTMTEEEYFKDYCERGCMFDQDEKGNPIFPIKYKNDGARRFYNALYMNTFSTETNTKENQSAFMNPFYMLANKSDYLYPDGEYSAQLFNEQDDADKNQKLINQYLSNKVEKQNSEYHSTIANNMLVNNLETNLNPMTLLIIAILTASIFVNEVRYKTDQILVPTTLGSRWLTPAKCITGFSVALGIVIIQWLIALLVASIQLPIHDLQSVVLNQQNIYTSIVNLAFTYGEILWKGFIITSLSGMIIAALTMMLSYMTKNRFGTIIPMLLFILGPLILPVFINIFENNFLDFLFPSRSILFSNLFSAGNPYSGTPYFVFDDNVISMFALDCGVYGVLCILLPGIMIWHSKKHIVKNR